MNVKRAVNYLILLFFCLHLSTLSAADGDEAQDLDEEEEIAVERWREAFGRIKKLVGSGIKRAMPYLMESMSDEDLQVSQECRRALFSWIADLKSTKPWALKMGDASAKAIDGMLTGTFATYGSYDQCLNSINPKGTIRGKYCSVEIRPRLPPKPRFYPLNQRLKAFKRFENDTGMLGEFTKYIQLFYMFPLRLGICVPSPCFERDMTSIASRVAKNLFHSNVSVSRCEVKEPVVIENFQIPMLCVIAILIALVCIGTLYDIFVYQKRDLESEGNKSLLSDCMMSFSAIENWNKLMNLETGSEDLSCLHGIRFFCMCWIILGHTYFHLNFNILRHLQITIELTSQFIFNSVTNATLVVDNFFFLSGLLVVYVTIDLMKVVGKVPRVVYFIIHRFWRFLPIQMFFVGCTTLLPLFGDGPTWHENIDPLVEGCRRDWWANMIFINNLYRSTEAGCLSYSWYLAADFQVYIFCIPIAILIIRKPRLGLCINFVVIMLSIMAVAVHTYVRDLPPTLLFTRADVQQRNELMLETYYTPYHHLAPFCIGMFIGYYLQKYKRPINMHWVLHVAAWVGTFTVTSAALFGVHPWNIGYGAIGVVPTLLYASLSRVGWTLGLAWITVACSSGCGGILGRILRSKVYVPFSRLTFLVYMVHPLVQHVFYATLRDGIQALNHLAIFICFGYIISSYGIALILSIFLESPFINLGKVIFKRRQSGKERRKATAHSSCIENAPPARMNAHWKSGAVPPLTNGYGKSNGAFDFRPEIQQDDLRAPHKNLEDTRGDFICHL